MSSSFQGTSKNVYELKLTTSDKERRPPFEYAHNASSSLSVFESDVKKQRRDDDLINESEITVGTRGDDPEVKTPLVANVHVADASVSSVGSSKMGLGLNEYGEEEEPVQHGRKEAGYQEYQLYKRRWVGVVALVRFSKNT
jgi:hypothetical protein